MTPMLRSRSLLTRGLSTRRTNGGPAGRPRLMLEPLEGRDVPASSLGATSLVEGPSAGTDAVLLTTSASWVASSNDPSWLHVSTGSGTGTTAVVFTVDANTGGTRVGTLTIDGHALTVTQAATGYVAGTGTLTIASGLNAPTGVAVDKTGNVYFSDTSNQAVKMWDAATQQVTTLISSGLNNPYGLALDDAGNVYIADRMGNAVLEWNATSGLTTLVSSGLSYPMGVAVDAAGNVYIADTNANQVKKWNPTGGLTTVVSSGLSLPVGLSFDLAGNLLIADAGNSAIKKWNAADGLTTLISTGLNCAYSVVADVAGNLYIADTNGNSVKKWDPATQQLTTLISSGLNFPVAVGVTSAGSVVVSDTMHNTLKLLPREYLSTAAVSVSAGAGSSQLPAVVPDTLGLTGTLAPTSDQSWLTISGAADGVVTFSYTANTSTSPRTAHITLLGRQVTVTQAGRFTPTFSGLSAPTITYGTATTTISGTLNPNGGGQMIPGTEYVSVTINGVTQQAYLDANDQFTTSFDTHALHYRASGYTISFSYAGDSNFTSASTSRTLTVQRYAFTYQIGNAAQTYGSPANLAGALGTAIATGVNGEELGISYSSPGDTATAHIGTYGINGSLSNRTGLTADYTVTLQSGALTVGKYAFTYQIGDVAQTYGSSADLAGTLGTTIATGVNGQTLGISYTSLGDTATAHARAYAIGGSVADGTGQAGDYDVTLTDGTLTVQRYAFTHQIGDATQTYGSPADLAGTLGATFATGVNGQTLGISYTSPGDTATAHAGAYAIDGSVADGTGQAGDYDVTLVSGTLTVQRYAFTHQIGDATQTYGSPADLAGTLGATFATGVNGQTLGISYTSLGDTATAHAGAYTIGGSVADGTGQAGDYDVTLVSGTLTVQRYAFTHQIGDAAQTYGSPANLAGVLGTTIATGVNGEALTIQYVSVGNTTSASPGAYAITGALSDGTGQCLDYQVTLTPGVLTVTDVPETNTEGYSTGAGTGGGPRVLAYNPDGSVRFDVYAFDPSFTGGIRVATADVTGGGPANVVVGSGPGMTATVVVLDGNTGAVTHTLTPFGSGFSGGVFVATGDFSRDGTADVVITPDLSGGPRVVVVDGNTGAQLADFLALNPDFRGGLNVAVGDVNGDGVPDVVVGAGAGGGPRVAIFDGRTLSPGQTPTRLVNDFFVFEPEARMGVRVAVGDLDGDGLADVIVGTGSGGGARVIVMTGAAIMATPLGGVPTALANFFADTTTSRDGARVSVCDANSDGQQELVVGVGSSRLPVFTLASILASPSPEPVDYLDPFGEFAGGVFVG